MTPAPCLEVKRNLDEVDESESKVLIEFGQTTSFSSPGSPPPHKRNSSGKNFADKLLTFQTNNEFIHSVDPTKLHQMPI